MTMTKREFLTAILNGEQNEILQNFAKLEIEKLNARNEKRSTTPSKTQEANKPLKEAIIKELPNHDGKMLVKEVATFLEVSSQKATALLLQLEKEGKLESLQVKVKGQGKRKMFKLV